MFGWNTYLKPAARKLASFTFANFWQSAMVFFLFVFLTFMIFFNNAFMMFFNYVKFPNSIDFSAAAIASIFETAIAIVPFFALTALFFAYFGYNRVKNQKKDIIGCVAAGFIISLISCLASVLAMMPRVNMNTKAVPSGTLGLDLTFLILACFDFVLVVFSTLSTLIGAVHASRENARAIVEK